MLVNIPCLSACFLDQLPGCRDDIPYVGAIGLKRVQLIRGREFLAQAPCLPSFRGILCPPHTH